MHFAREGRLGNLLRKYYSLALRHTRHPSIGAVQLGQLDRVQPISNDWGFDRGLPVDRHYIENFLAAHTADIEGRVLEVADNEYTIRFGGNRVSRSDILHNKPGHSKATLVLDLGGNEECAANLFDCIICTQTLHLVYQMTTAINTLQRLLKPGGVLLLTAPAVSRISREDMEHGGDYWRFTSAALQRLFAEHFGAQNIRTFPYGNVYAATAFLHGLAVEDLDPEKLDYNDKDFEVLIALRAVKSSGDNDHAGLQNRH